MNSIARQIEASRIAAVRANIADAAARTGSDFDFLLSTARLESGLDANARARSSSAAGPFQFTQPTWLDMIDRHGAEHGLAWAANAIDRVAGKAVIGDRSLLAAINDLRFDPKVSADMAGALTAENRTLLSSGIGRSPDDVELYLAHFLGASGAVQFIQALASDPDADAATLFPRAAAANRTIFYDRAGLSRSLADIKALFVGKFEVAKAGPEIEQRPITTARWIERRRSSQSADGAGTNRLALQEIVDIPDRPSIEFAARSYRQFIGTER